MSFEKRYLSGALTLLTTALLLASCGDSNDGSKGAGRPKKVPRNRTLILDCIDQNCQGQIQDYDSFHPYIPGNVSRTGYNFLYEPLYFYNAYREEDGLIPWIAESHQFNEDFTEVVIKIREGVKWSDGLPWTAVDLVFTIDMLKAHAPELTFSVDMQTWVEEAEVVDDLTARIRLTAPNPRFIFSYFTHNFDNGVPIIPKHIWEGKDPGTFSNLDIDRGWPVVSGPYRLVLSSPEQRIWDLRQDWWATEIGFQELPKVERLIYLPFMDEAKRTQNLIVDNLDVSGAMLPPNIRAALEQNPRISTWSGRDIPYGYLDWWPISLGFNALEEPFSDPEFRWAITHAIDRRQLVEIGYQGAGSYTLYPFPDFPPLKRYVKEITDLFEKYPVGVYDPARSAAIMERKGWTRDAEGFWTKDGKRAKIVIDTFEILQDITPILVEQLRKAGFDASFRMTSDTYTRMSTGAAHAYTFGHGGSVRDPYFTLRLYHSRFIEPTGTATPTFWRWRNEKFDALVDRMGQTSPDDPQLAALFRRAMEIWLRELPSVPLVQFYHRIAHNHTYWKNWPSRENPYINSAYWHRTWLLILLGLEPAQD